MAFTDQNRKYQLTSQNMSELVSIVGLDGNIVFASPSHKQLLGFSTEGKNVFDIIHPEDVEETRALMTKAIETKVEHTTELRLRKINNDWLLLEVKGTPVLDEEGKVKHIVAISRDISERKEAEKQILSLSYFDQLTGLANHRSVKRYISQHVESDSRNEQFAVICLGLDRFKFIYGTPTQKVENKLLKIMAERLTEVVGQDGLISRFRDNEFMVVLHYAKDELDQRLNAIVNVVQQPLHCDEKDYYIGPAVGVSRYPNDGDSSDVLITCAEVAMAEAGGENHTRFKMFDKGIRDKISRRNRIEQDLHKALAENEFILFYQPQIDSDKKIIGVEALVRWYHPEFGIVSPQEFISIAENNGIINSIGEWVLRTACEQHKEWLNNGFEPIRMSVNLSISQFEKTNLVEEVKSILDETGMNPQHLELEITESVALFQSDYVIKQLKNLRKIGVRIAIDDFGTGYSSLGYLNKLPADTLKVDRSFIKQIIDSKSALTITSAIITLAHNLKFDIVAEGVESKNQFDKVKELGVDYIQGYYYCPPVDPEHLEIHLTKRRDVVNS